MPDFAAARAELPRLFPIALRAAQPEIRRLGMAIEHGANRRMTRDAERIHSYYRDLQVQIEKRIARHKNDPPAAEKERTRAAATELDRAAKLDDLARKYALRIHIEPGDVLTVLLPVREIAVRLVRKKFGEWQDCIGMRRWASWNRPGARVALPSRTLYFCATTARTSSANPAWPRARAASGSSAANASRAANAARRASPLEACRNVRLGRLMRPGTVLRQQPQRHRGPKSPRTSAALSGN